MSRANYVTDDESCDIYDLDNEFMDADKVDGEYYIGLAGNVENQTEPILLSAISTVAFMRHNSADVLRYLMDYSASSVITNPEINIVKLSIDDRQTYNVTIKTHGLRTLQRHWKSLRKRQ
jgi:hypothetical protein